MSKVALIRCESYEYDEVRAAVERGIGLIGGPGMFVRAGEKILLKPNMLATDAPEKCSVTHYAVFKAVAEAFLKTDAVLSYGDSPVVHSPEAAARKTLIAGVAEELEVPMADFHKDEEIFFKEGIQNKKFRIAKGVLESDGLISIPKLKTHGLARMTGCIKNQFGCIPGSLKAEFHVRIPNALDFCRMLVDLNNFLKPRLFIMDGIYAMEGNGPRSGTPRKMNVLLFSSDPIALDAIVCRIINLNPEYVPTIKFGMEAGLGTYLEQDIELVGDPIEEFQDKDFNITREPVKPYKPGKAVDFLKNALVPKPVIDEKKCLKCGVCVNMCPVNPKALDWHDEVKSQVPSYIYKRCIRCYCCQELCPEGVISLKVPLVRRILRSGKRK